MLELKTVKPTKGKINMCNKCQKQSKIKFYNNNPVKILLDLGEYSVVTLQSGFSDEDIVKIASHNCEGCLTGMAEYCNHEKLELLATDALEVLSSNVGCFFVLNSMLSDEPVEFKRYKEVIELTKKEEERFKEASVEKFKTLEENEKLKKEQTALNDVLEDLQNSINAKKEELKKLEKEVEKLNEVKEKNKNDTSTPKQELKMPSANVSDENVVISKEKYIELLTDSNRLMILDNDGVDNWRFYYESYSEFIADSLFDLTEGFNLTTQELQEFLSEVELSKEEWDEVLNLVTILSEEKNEENLEKLTDIVDLEKMSRIECWVHAH